MSNNYSPLEAKCTGKVPISKIIKFLPHLKTNQGEMAEKIVIEDLDKLLQPNFDVPIQIVEYTTKRLTAAGDNYGSLMVLCDVKLKKEKCDDVQELHLVVKMSPPNEWLRTMLKVHITYRKEIGIYTEAVPALKEFLEKQGQIGLLDSFPKCYGARLASNNPASEKIYKDSVILLENLKSQGFVTLDRIKGFNLGEIELLMMNLAVFHAVPIAMKMIDPDTFHKKVLPYLDNVIVFDSISKESKRQIIKYPTQAAAKNKKCEALLPALEKALILGGENVQANKVLPPLEPFATFIHNDLWVTNAMIRFEKDKPKEAKFLDFQLTAYGSPGNDIVFLLFSSAQKVVLEKHYESVLKLYYTTFIDTLTRLKCDTTLFTYETLLEEIDSAAKTTQSYHVVYMLQHILAKKGSVKDISELSEESIFQNAQVTDEYTQRIPDTVLTFAKKGWL